MRFSHLWWDNWCMNTLRYSLFSGRFLSKQISSGLRKKATVWHWMNKVMYKWKGFKRWESLELHVFLELSEGHTVVGYFIAVFVFMHLHWTFFIFSNYIYIVLIDICLWRLCYMFSRFFIVLLGLTEIATTWLWIKALFQSLKTPRVVT